MNIEKINLSDIDDFENHPYKLKEDEELHLLMESIRLNGLITPLTVRKKENGRYEMISGHRRKRALELLMIYKADAYVYDLTDDEATIMMVDSNIYREQVLPSEKAFACKMKLEALKHQGIASGQVGPKSLTTDLIGLAYKESGRTIKRYIRLTYLIPKLLKIVDDSYSSNSKAANNNENFDCYRNIILDKRRTKTITKCYGIRRKIPKFRTSNKNKKT